MDIVMIVRTGGLAESEAEVVKTLVGSHLSVTSAVSVNDNINWYAEFSAGDPLFNRISRTSTIQAEADSSCVNLRGRGRRRHSIQYHVVDPDEAKHFIEEHGGYRRT